MYRQKPKIPLTFFLTIFYIFRFSFIFQQLKTKSFVNLLAQAYRHLLTATKKPAFAGFLSLRPALSLSGRFTVI